MIRILLPPARLKAMYNYVPVLCFALLVLSCRSEVQEPSTTSNTAPKPQAPVDKNWAFKSEPVWADEFNYTGEPDPAKWGYDIGGSGWGNNELQYYTNSRSNSNVADGTLKITARKENVEGKEYSSARLVSKDKGDFLYGRFEIKAKLPTGRGTWPALWMLPTNWAYGGWPESGEIDIMEHVGYDQDRVHITVHTEAYNHSKAKAK